MYVLIDVLAFPATSSGHMENLETLLFSKMAPPHEQATSVRVDYRSRHVGWKVLRPTGSRGVAGLVQCMSTSTDRY